MLVAKAARRYADALFRLAAEEGVLDTVAADLRALGELARHSAPFSDLLTRPGLSSAAKASALEALLGGSAHALTLRFLRFLVARRRAGLFPGICADFEERHLRARNIQRVSITSATPLSAEQVEALRARLAARLGTEIRLAHHVDPSLIAGFRLRIGDQVEDHTAAAQIARFHQAVLNA